MVPLPYSGLLYPSCHFCPLLYLIYTLQGDHAKKGSPNSKKGCVTSVLHWHAHGFGALQFTDDGTYLLSGGNEKVLVQWHMRDGHKQFLPRLGGAIQGIAVSARGDMFAVTCADNTIRVISSISSRVKTVIRGVVTRRPDPVCKSHGTVKFDQSPAMQRPFELHPDPRIPGHVVIVAPNNTNVQVYDVVRGCNKLQIGTHIIFASFRWVLTGIQKRTRWLLTGTVWPTLTAGGLTTMVSGLLLACVRPSLVW